MRPFHGMGWKVCFVVLGLSLLGLPGSGVTEQTDSYVAQVEAVWTRQAIQALRFGLPDQFLSTLKAAYDSGGLPGWLMELDRNLLDSVDEDGMVFTQGTLDTLGAWIWQYVHGYRRDVTVIPLGLLDKPWYLLQLKESRHLIPVGAPIAWPRLDILQGKTPPWDGSPLRLGQDAREMVLDAAPLTSGQLYTPATLSALMHILQCNNGERPVLFSPWVKGALLEAFAPYLSRHGLGYALEPQTSTSFSLDVTLQWARSAQFDALKQARGAEADSVSLLCARLHSLLAKALNQAGRPEDAQWAQTRVETLLSGRLLAPQPE